MWRRTIKGTHIDALIQQEIETAKEGFDVADEAKQVWERAQNRSAQRLFGPLT